jgi:hypothetical protein
MTRHRKFRWANEVVKLEVLQRLAIGLQKTTMGGTLRAWRCAEVELVPIGSINEMR